MFAPISLNLAQRPVFIIGGGAVAARKTPLLLKAGAVVTIISPSFHPDLLAIDDGNLVLQQRPAGEEEFPVNSLVVMASSDDATNDRIADIAKQQGALICRSDTQEGKEADFAFCAIVDRSPLLIGISTQGSSPALTRLLKQHIEAIIPRQYGILAEQVRKLRRQLKTKLDSKSRPLFWRRWIASPAVNHVIDGDLEGADHITQDILSSTEQGHGEVYLVGAGPGDPDLLTVKAVRLIQSADIVFYDRLVNPKILQLISSEAQRFYVGKARSDHAVPQDEINQLLVKEAMQGKRVMRLKGGDPFVFGRGGEEIEELAKHQIPFQVIPAVTAATGCAAYSGIPLTHRDHAQSVRFVTGHLKNDTCDLPWSELANPNQTLVIYMGLNAVHEVCDELIKHGLSSDMPIALVEKGTLPEQRVHVATLSTMSDLVNRSDIKSPTLTIIGTVVNLHEQLKWR